MEFYIYEKKKDISMEDSNENTYKINERKV
jgi:hypothetical protein